MTPQEQHRNNRVVWFEIPVADLDRAAHFYEQTLGTTLKRQEFGPDLTPIAIFTYDAPAVGGCLVKTDRLHPASTGSLVFLNADPSLDLAIARARQNGGAVITPRTALPPGMGYWASIRDTEGNTVGLHAIS